MTAKSNDSPPLQEFAISLGVRDPKTVATDLTTMRDFVAWLATQPGGTLFHLAPAPSSRGECSAQMVDILILTCQ